jgi:hypothetical protein
MAHDYLAIQESVIPSEWAFSGGGLTGTRLCNWLDIEIFEGLQILKSVYRNSHIAAMEQAGQYYDTLIASMDATSPFNTYLV